MKQFLASSERFLFYPLLFFLPTQFGKHFWPDFSYVLGIRIDYLSPTIFFTDVLIVFLFLAWLFRLLKEKLRENSKLQVKDKKFFILICGFTFCFLLFNIFISGRVLGGLYTSLKMLEMLFVGLYTAKFMPSRNDLKNILSVFSCGVVFESLLAISQFAKQGSIGGPFYYFGERTFSGSTPGIANASLSGQLVLRPYGTLPHPNVLAGYLVVGMTLALYSLRFQNNKKESRSKNHEVGFVLVALRVLVLILGTIALFLSMSRVAIVLWIIVVFSFFLPLSFRMEPKTRMSINWRSLHALFLVGMTIVIAVVFLSPLGARFKNLNFSDESIVQREVLTAASLQMIAKHPLVGAGLSNFLQTLASMERPLAASTYLQPVHNIFLLVAAETGLVGLAIFLWFLWKTFSAINHQPSTMRELLLVLFFIILITGFFDHYWLTLQQGQLLFAFIIGLCYNPNLYGRTSRQ